MQHDGPRLVAEGALPPGAGGLDLVEGLAQALGCLGRLNGEQGDAVLLGLEAVQLGPLPPLPEPSAGPTGTARRVTYAVEVLTHSPRITEARGVATIAGEVVCTATLRAALL